MKIEDIKLKKKAYNKNLRKSIKEYHKLEKRRLKDLQICLKILEEEINKKQN